MNLRWRDPASSGRHAAGEAGRRTDPWWDWRGLLLMLGVVLGLARIVARWLTATPMLGANLGEPAHAALVTAFLLVALVGAYTVLWQGYRRLARWSQSRRARRRREQL